MHISNIMLPLAAAGMVVASPLVEKRAAESCALPRISSLVEAVFKPSAVPFCNTLLGVDAKTITNVITKTRMASKTFTSIKTVTADAAVTVKVTVKAQGGASVTAAPQTITSGESVPKNPESAQVVTASAVANGTIAARDFLERRAAATPSRLRTLKPAMLSSVCSCLTKPTVTVRSTKVVGGITEFATTTVSGSGGSKTVTQTVTASPVPFYLRIPKNTNSTSAGQYAAVNGESIDFQNTTEGATKFTIDSEGHLVSGSNGWVANMQKDSKYATLFFDSPDLITELGLVEVTCNRKGGPLSCSSQSGANSFYFCETVGTELVFAGADYQALGCTSIKLNAINA